jgi:hypothetical protein
MGDGSALDKIDLLSTVTLSPSKPPLIPMHDDPAAFPLPDTLS